MRAHVFTDRPLYRPGETVRVKGILRDLKEDGLAIPAACEGKLTLRDPRGREVLDQGCEDRQARRVRYGDSRSAPPPEPTGSCWKSRTFPTARGARVSTVVSRWPISNRTPSS